MKIFSFYLCLAAFAIMAIEGSERISPTDDDHDSHSHSCECHHHGSHSGSGSHSHSHEKYIYKCNNNEWVNYMLDDAPAEDGVYIGDYAPGVPAFIAGYRGIYRPTSAWIKINEPKGGFYWFDGEQFSNDTQRMFYLKKNCHHHYEWVDSTIEKEEPYAIQPFYDNINGIPFYYGRIKNDENTVSIITLIAFDLGKAFYKGANGDMLFATNYQVLTCKSKVYEEPIDEIPPSPIPDESTEILDPNGCIHEWRPYNNDDEPIKYGISAGLYDVDNYAYVGKGYNDMINLVARLQVNEPGRGLHMAKAGKPFFQKSGGSYLVNNPNYNYYWVDATPNYLPPNVVRIKIGGPKSLDDYCGRLQVDGQTQVSLVAYTIGMFYFAAENVEKVAKNYQLLVCDPKPVNPCKQEWKSYKNNDDPSIDGHRVDFYANNIVSYIGRSKNKEIQGHDYAIGRCQISPFNESGIYTSQSVNGGEKFDRDHGEYLVKNSGDIYEWKNSHTGQEVENALKIPIKNDPDCCHQHKHHKEFAYIGRFYLDNVAYVGTVYENEGLVFVDVEGRRKVVSSYQVLTCASHVKNEIEDDSSHCNHDCLDEEKFYFV